MKEGRLSSALQERYGIKNPVGKVLWHSLNESGKIGRNLLAEDIEATIEEGHGHPAKRDGDKDRAK